MDETIARHIELTTDLVQAELVNSMAWLIDLRWMAGVGVLSATWLIDVVLHLALPTIPLYLIGIAILAYNAIFRAILTRLLRAEQRNVRQFDSMTKLQIGCDWLAMTALIHFSGGVASPLLFYFFFHVVIAAILLSRSATFLYAAVATLLVGGTALLEYVGGVQHVNIFGSAGATLHREPLFVIGVLLFFASTMFVVAYVTTTLSQRLRKREKQIVKLGQNLLGAYNRLRTVYEATEAVNSTLELEEVLDRLVRRTADALRVRACSIHLLDETGARLYVAASYGLSEAYVKKGDLLLEQNPLAREVLAGKSIIIDDIATDPRLQYPAEALTEGIHAMMTSPLLGKKGPLGLVRAYSMEVNQFSQDDVEFLATIAREGSIAIENAIAYRALGKLDEMKSKFVLIVTHELRSPVSVIRSLLRTLLAGYLGGLTDDQREAIARVLHRADFLQTLIDDLLDLAAGKSAAGAREERVVVRLDEAIARVVKRFEILAQEKQIKFEFHSVRGVTISATNEGMDRILNNLVSNAIKYTPSGGRVTVALSADANNANIAVTDTGIGIPAEAVSHLFEEFYRAPNAKAQEKEGTGLGLAITKDLVNHFGGHIAVQSKEGHGTTFTVTFPTIVELPV